jgi:histidine kinase 2/3/4 (cytokinin receptor)
VENLLRQMAGSQIIAVNVYDITNDTMPLVMYGHTNVERSGNTYVSELDFGDPDRKHEMRCRCVGLFYALSILRYLFI